MAVEGGGDCARARRGASAGRAALAEGASRATGSVFVCFKRGGWTVPNVTGVGHADVAYGRVEYSPAGIPHSWKA